MIKVNRKLLFFPVLAIGVFILIFAIKSRPDVPIKPALSKARPVDVIRLNQQPFAPVVVGFGRVTPKRRWQGIAEVSGKVIYRNPLLEKGQVIEENTLLLEIDPTDYQISVAKAKADMSAIEAKIAKLGLDKKSLTAKLNIEKRRLKLSENELTRQRNLKKKGLTSQSVLDQQQQEYLAQQSREQELSSQLNTIPAELRMAKAEAKATELALAQAQRNLKKTQLRLPFTSRIASVNIEKDQVVTNNQVMVDAHGLGAVEVEAQVTIHDMQTLFSSLTLENNDDFSKKLLALKAHVTLSSGNYTKSWPAIVTRLSDTVNATQAMVGVILDIPLNEEQKQGIGATPTLVNGMFVEARISGKATPHWVIPERALHGDSLYIAVDNKLQILPVSVLFRQDGNVAVSGDFSKLPKTPLLVLNDLIPALEGMLLQIKNVDGKAASGEASL